MLLRATTLAFLPFLLGCSSNVDLHPALRLEEADLDKAKETAQRALLSHADPYRVYQWTSRSVGERVSADVILQDATMCLPQDEVAFAIVKNGDSDPQAVDRVAREAARRAGNEVKFLLVLQISKTKSPKGLTFELRTNTGEKYPPLAVEEPQFIREVTSALDPTIPPGALYSYTVHFPIRGSPGYPPIDSSVGSLNLVVQDGASEGGVTFSLRDPSYGP